MGREGIISAHVQAAVRTSGEAHVTTEGGQMRSSIHGDLAPELESPAGQSPVDVRLLIPNDDVADPMISIVVPALDEERTVGEFVDWCREGLARVGVPGEILIVSSSTDRTDEIALAHGARVLSTPKRGLGRAYIDATPYIRGKYVVVGDADCTYDFREIGPFIDKLREGYDFVMGSRFRGTIERDAMPKHHRYFGTPITNWIFNLVLRTHFSDIHCGMRGLTKETYQRIGLQSHGWEYASEMILKSLHLGLRTTEIPIDFYRDRNGRISTVKRRGWLTPWKAGWDSLRIMFTHGADFFLFRPGLLLAMLGLAATALMTHGPLRIGATVLASNSHFLAVAVSVMGVSAIYLGILARVINDLTGSAARRWMRVFPYNRTFTLSAALAVLGVAPNALLIAVFVSHSLSIPASAVGVVHAAITGMLLVMIGFMTFTFTLVLHALAFRLSR
jgi:glycosyltransferase involved in cell wall biosynthesis